MFLLMEMKKKKKKTRIVERLTGTIYRDSAWFFLFIAVSFAEAPISRKLIFRGLPLAGKTFASGLRHVT